MATLGKNKKVKLQHTFCTCKLNLSSNYQVHEAEEKQQLFMMMDL